MNAPLSAIRPSATSSVPLRGAIFDMDGVLTDTIEFHYQTWQRLADEERIPFDRQANEALRGLSRRDSLLRMLDGRTLPEAKMQELLDRKNQYFREFVKTMSSDHLLPGVRDFLDDLRAAGVKTAVASASQNVYVVVEQLGIADDIDAITNVYCVDRPKPAPDVFLHAAERLNLSPSECVVFEDAESGVEAALAAKMHVVGLGPVDRVGAAHWVLPSLNGLRWADLQAKFEK
ncbi:MAG: beta-phosphoglucomutase [Cyanobacteria bacterium SID2]|nr:beta-phosphoglucomutase [Cyanobacteria bacterium SID2]MBP0003519.1 beta-phosphoglucomutase [Cyanobacteria bacterium SBC]